jgi:hypothetical protein
VWDARVVCQRVRPPRKDQAALARKTEMDVVSVHAPEAGAPETKIKITPEMIAAGARALLDGSGMIDLGPTLSEIYAERVLRAALSRSSRGKRKSV